MEHDSPDEIERLLEELERRLGNRWDDDGSGVLAVPVRPLPGPGSHFCLGAPMAA